jgi:hypothetical protein
MKRSNRKRHRPEEVVAKLRQADEALAKGTPIGEVPLPLGFRGPEGSLPNRGRLFSGKASSRPSPAPRARQ